MGGGIFERIGSLTERFRKRFGRPFGHCRTCGKPTRSHQLGSGVQCHSCHRSGERVPMTDGGVDADPDAALEAFEDAISFFQEHLDDPLPDTIQYQTARDYFECERQWEGATIEDKRLGYAPADDTALLHHLRELGYDDDDILGTGLFYEPDKEWQDDPHPHFKGRYVFPYFHTDGEPVYAISRSINADDGGHPEDHHGEQKYTKAVKSKGYSAVDEPIYGLGSVTEDTDRLLVAGGIADAITLHEQGYACISPVTTVRFKGKHEQRVVELVDEFDIETVYIVNDVERPVTDARELAEGETVSRIRDVLTLHQWGEGLRAAFANAEFLLGEGIPTKFVRLPGGDGDLRKVDPDDFVKDGWATVETVLAGATGAEQHPGYSEWKESKQQRQRAETLSTAPSVSEGDNTSGIYDLSFDSLTGLSPGHRGTNPLGHHGNSEDYFVVVRDSDGVYGFDHKYGTAYIGLTYLLCDAGIRRPDNPNGPLSNEETFEVWRYAKRSGVVPEDDPIPRAALSYVATSNEFCTSDEIEDGWKLPADAYNAAINHIESEHGISSGREKMDLEGGDGSDHAVAIPTGIVKALSDDELLRVVKRNNAEYPDTEEVRDRLKDAIRESMQEEETVAIDSPTSSGKSHTVSTTPWKAHQEVTGNQPVIVLSDTRAARDENYERAQEHDIECRKLLGRGEACDVAGGETGLVIPDEHLGDTPAKEWFDIMCDRRGIPFSKAHKKAEELCGELPCCRDDQTCYGISQWEGIPRTEKADYGQCTAIADSTDERCKNDAVCPEGRCSSHGGSRPEEEEKGDPSHDVIFATHGFSHVPGLVMESNIIFDEQPQFQVDLSTKRVQDMVSSFLKTTPSHIYTWEQFVSTAKKADDGDVTESTRYDIKKVEAALNYDPQEEWLFGAEDAHSLAPAIADSIWKAIKDGADANGRYSKTVSHHPQRPDDHANGDFHWNAHWVSVVLDEDFEVEHTRDCPSVSGARSVIGLDAWPAQPIWQLNVHPDITTRNIMTKQERILWRRLERNLWVVQLDDKTRPYSGKNAVEWFKNGNRQRIPELSHLNEHFGTDAAVAPHSVREEMEEAMGEAGIEDPDILWQNNLKSRNDFDDKDSVVVDGCIDPGDGYVLNLIAEFGYDAVPETHTCNVCGGEAENDNCENGRCQSGVVRDYGRGFDGENADVANAILESVRANNTAQAAGRVARNPDDPDDFGVAFLRTNAVPDSLVDIEVPGCVWGVTDLQRQMIERLCGQRDELATASELAEEVGCSKQHVHDTMSKLESEGLVVRKSGVGKHGADVFEADDSLDSGRSAGSVDLNDFQPDTGPTGASTPTYEDTHTWRLAMRVTDIDDVGSVRRNGGDARLSQWTDGESAGGPPPE
jgi:hypothetical protein